MPEAGQSRRPRRLVRLDPGEAHGGSHGGPQRVLEGALAALRSLARTAVDDVGPLGLPDSAAFASGVEELSRTLDYLQLVAAGQLHRVPAQGPAAGTCWATGNARPFISRPVRSGHFAAFFVASGA